MSFIQKISSIFSGEDEVGNSYLLGLDIGTGSVKAIIFSVEKENERKEAKAIITGFGESEIKKARSRQEVEREIVRSCYLAKKEAENMAGVAADKAIISASGRYVKCSTNIFDFLRDKPERIIDIFEIKSLLQRAQWKIFDKIRQKEDLESGILETEIKLLSGEIAGIKVGRYNIVNPTGFEGKELEISILNTYASKNFLNIIKNLNKLLGIEILHVTSHNRAILEAVSESILKAGSIGEASCFIADCGNKITDISVAQKGFFIGPKTISMGGAAFSRCLALKFNLSESEAEKLKRRYVAGDLSAQIKRKITDAFGELFEIWLKGIEESIGDFSKTLINMPFLFLLFGGGSFLGGFKKGLENPDWQKRFNFVRPTKVRNIAVEDIRKVEDKTRLLNSASRISSLALASFSLRLIRKESGLNSILNRVIRLMQN